MGMRKFESGATRDDDVRKLHVTRFFSPEVLKRRAEYMDKHRVMRDGSLREPDNWKAGMPQSSYIESMDRHVLDVKLWANGSPELYQDDIEEKLCAVMFNAEGLLYEILKQREELEEEE